MANIYTYTYINSVCGDIVNLINDSHSIWERDVSDQINQLKINMSKQKRRSESLTSWDWSGWIMLISKTKKYQVIYLRSCKGKKNIMNALHLASSLKPIKGTSNVTSQNVLMLSARLMFIQNPPLN